MRPANPGNSSSARRGLLLPTLAGLWIIAGASSPAGATGIRLVSHLADSETSAPPDRSYWETMSSDGEAIVFRSFDTGFVAGVDDTNMTHDLFEWQRSTGEILLISHSSDSLLTTANAPSSTAFASSDGRFVAFASLATNLVSGVTDSNQGSDAFLWDRSTGAVALISRSVSPPTATANGVTSPEGISADGRFVLFSSTATDLIPGGQDDNDEADLFLWDAVTETVQLITHSATSETTAADMGGGSAFLSADGSRVGFLSGATNLVAGMVPGPCAGNTFSWDRASNTNVLVSHAAGSALEAADACASPVAWNGDGTRLCFTSDATNLVPGQVDANGMLDAFLWDRGSGQVYLVSHTSGSPSIAGDGPSEPRSISGDGRFVALTSFATDLVAGIADGNGASDAFLFDFQSGELSLLSHTVGNPNVTSDNHSEPISVADNGAVLLESYSDDLTGDEDSNGTGDVFLWTRPDDTVTLLSRASGVPGASDHYSEGELLSADGRWVGVVSFSTNLAPGVSPTTPQVYQAEIPLFADGFQSGDTGRWNPVVP
jgi:hypothetical protein